MIRRGTILPPCCILEPETTTSMATYIFIPDAGRQLPEIKQKGAHTASKSRSEEEELEDEVPNFSATQRLEQLARELGFHTEGVHFHIEDETVHLKGKVKNQELKEKLVLLSGNLQGISEVVEELTPQDTAEAAHFHTVTREDNLKIISQKYFEDANRYMEIIEANAPFIKKEGDIYPGMVIRIPSLNQK